MLAGARPLASGASRLLVVENEKLKALWCLDFVTLEVPIDTLDGLAQLPVRIGLQQATDRNFRGARIFMASGEHRWDAFLPGRPCQLDTGLLLA